MYSIQFIVIYWLYPYIVYCILHIAYCISYIYLSILKQDAYAAACQAAQTVNVAAPKGMGILILMQYTVYSIQYIDILYLYIVYSMQYTVYGGAGDDGTDGLSAKVVARKQKKIPAEV